MITYPRVRAFLTVAETLNFTQAASMLYISQPALSKMIATFENECGYQLFIRTNRAVSLTYEGKLLYQKLKDADQAILDAIIEVKGVHKGTHGTIRVAVGAVDPLPYRFYEILKRYTKEHQTINFEFNRYQYYDMNLQQFETHNDLFIINMTICILCRQYRSITGSLLYLFQKIMKYYPNQR